MNRRDLIDALKAEDFSPYYRLADKIRFQEKGNYVDIRAILEFSNICRRKCVYCGLNCRNQALHRYRMTPDEIVDAASAAARAGYRTLVMQSGEDPWFTPKILGGLVKEIKKTGMAVTLSCGEMPKEAYAYLRECGADRYLLKHETADPEIYSALHPDSSLQQRIACLKVLKHLGYETGSGFMIGLPGQTAETLADDLLLLQEIGCDMAGMGPFIPHPDTPLRELSSGSTETTKRVVALARILLPKLNLPATTSLGVLSGSEKNDVFSCGANVVMRKVTPTKYKRYYEIYPAKLGETHVIEDRKLLEQQITALERVPR
ncbi:MAG: [FeFe] hydrogenase H-cluster radical SAM maturase HydE [[Clostridium] leptum]